MNGPVFGAPVPKEFIASPPIAFAGGSHGKELWLDAVMPAETLKAAGSFLKK